MILVDTKEMFLYGLWGRSTLISSFPWDLCLGTPSCPVIEPAGGVNQLSVGPVDLCSVELDLSLFVLAFVIFVFSFDGTKFMT